MASALGGKGGWLALVVIVAFLDQATKALAREVLEYRVPVPVAPGVNLTLTYNPGAAFSFLGDAGGWQRWLFVAIGSLVSAGLLAWLLRLPRGSGRALPLALALVVGGALGNVWDRLSIGAVVDFVDLHWRGYHWPAFNLADSAITLGAGLLIALSLRKESPAPKSSDEPAARTREASKAHESDE